MLVIVYAKLTMLEICVKTIYVPNVTQMVLHLALLILALASWDSMVPIANQVYTYLSCKLNFITIDMYVIKRFNSFYFILECENCNANGIEDSSSCENSCTCKSGYADAGGIGCSVCASGYFSCASPSASLCDESTDCSRKRFHTFMKC